MVQRVLEIWEGVFRVRGDGEKERYKAVMLDLGLRCELLMIRRLGV